MDTESLKEGLTVLGAAIKMLKSLKPLIPSGAKRDEAERLLSEAELKMKEAEARLAKDLGFRICKRCWPPEIMTQNDVGEWVCRCCGKPVHNDDPPRITPGNPMFGDVGNW